MRISDIVNKTYKDVNEMARFDLKSLSKKPKWYLQLVAWVLSFPETFFVKSKIIKRNMDSLEGPYILLCNHNSFLDFKVATRAIFPKRANYIVAIDGFIGREWLLRNVGGVCTRKFVPDYSIVKQIKNTLEVNKVVCEIYPEARYSLVGTNSELPESLGKLVKMLKYPVVTLISHGHHLRQPFWNLKKRKVQTKSYLTQILTQNDLVEKDVEEINEIINGAFYYDDYRYQFDNNINIKVPFRAEGLHKVLYKCPYCYSEFMMESKGIKLRCNSCHTEHEMDERGQLHAIGHKTIYSHIPTWFEWQRAMVRQEIVSGKYKITQEVDIESLPNSKGFYRLKRGVLKHDINGFHLYNEDFSIKKPVMSSFGVHIEYDYFGKGDCISFSTINDTYYLYPIDQKYSVTKYHFAVEELYRLGKNN